MNNFNQIKYIIKNNIYNFQFYYFSKKKAFKLTISSIIFNNRINDIYFCEINISIINYDLNI